LRDLGYHAVPIETAAGRAEYRERQRVFAERSNALRRRVLAVLDAVPAPPRDAGDGAAAGRPDQPEAATNQPSASTGTTSSAP
ncbi:MAG: hypothetical protein ACRCZD_21560, partial [Phycicoccus sp.]